MSDKMDTSDDANGVMRLAMDALTRAGHPNNMNMAQLALCPRTKWNQVTREGLHDADAKQDHAYDLNNEIHPLFRYAAWRDYGFRPGPWSRSYYTNLQFDVPVIFYQRLAPALRLASLLLEHASPFLVRVWRGPLHRLYPDQPHFDMMWTPSDADHASLQAELLALAQTTNIFWLPRETNVGNVAWGMTRRVRDDEAPPTTVGAVKRRLTHIGLHSQLLGYVNRTSWLTSTDLQKATISAQIAITLVHEVTHALYFSRRTMASSFAIENEPIAWTEPFQELGRSLVYFLFGFDLALGFWFGAGGERRRNGAIGLMGYKRYATTQEEHFNPYWISWQSVFDLFDRRTWAVSGAQLQLTVWSPASYEDTVPVIRERLIMTVAGRSRLNAEFARQYPNERISVSPTPSVESFSNTRLMRRRL